MTPLFPFPRQMGLKRQRCTDMDSMKDYVRRMNGRTDLYTSLYAFDDLGDYDSVVIDRAWWDFDMNDVHTMEQVKEDVAALLSRLTGDVRLVATGRGFHIHQPFKRPVRGRSWAFHLDRYEKAMAEGLKSLDGVGYPEKLTRLPGTFNRKRGRWCVVADERAFVSDPHGYAIPQKPDKTLAHRDPFRGEVDFDACFDLVVWNADNPYVAPKREERMTVRVGNHEGDVALPTCLDRASRLSNPPHHVRVALVQTMAQQLRWFADPEQITEGDKAEIVDNICDYIEELGWIDYNAAVTRKYVQGMMRYRNAPGPAWFRKHNLCDGDCWFCSGGAA
jgi:hypothetical protein